MYHVTVLVERQALAVLFGKHKLYVGTQQEAKWQPKHDHLVFVLDGQPLMDVTQSNAAGTFEDAASGVKITRPGAANFATLEIKDLLKISFEARPISITNWTADSCFVHMDTAMEFGQLSGRAEGVLGQTYQRLWSPPDQKEGSNKRSYILHDVDSYTTTSVFASDCAVSTFEGLPYDMTEAATSWRKSVMDDVEEPADAVTGSSNALLKCANDKLSGGLKCMNRLHNGRSPSKTVEATGLSKKCRASVNVAAPLHGEKVYHNWPRMSIGFAWYRPAPSWLGGQKLSANSRREGM
eukprot:SM000084S23129  [mRNA]  locus=s84:288330:290318:+ [translate_table: standard]